MNIAELCFRKKTVVVCLALALAAAGVKSYFGLGRLEDPEFTIRSAQIVTVYPGATAEEVAERVTDPIETAVQRLGRVKHVTSTSYPGRSIVMVELQDKTRGADLPQIWDELRRKVGDVQGELPAGCSRSLVNDDYGDVYGVFYAISGDGFTPAELKEHAKMLRRELLLSPDVAKIDLLGERQQIVSLEIPRAKIASLGITPEMISRALAGHTVPGDAGNLHIGDKSVRISLASTGGSLDHLDDVLVAEDVYLGDICRFRYDYADPPSVLVHRNGKPCLAIGISTAKGGNVITMGKAVERRMRELLEQTPIGIEVDVISHQATSVEAAVGGFVENLIESVVLVVAVLLITMGLRSGILIGGVLVLTVLGTVWVMGLFGLMFERISLGAFIIALGMLVDNAIVITEAVLVADRQGRSRLQAAVDVVRQTQWSLLGGTLIAILSFAPIGGSQNASGEYCRSLFLVIAISLFISWVLAITVTPLLAERFLKTGASAAAPRGVSPVDPYGGAFFRLYRRFLSYCIGNKCFVLLVLVCLLAVSAVGFRHVRRNFFPDSTRPQFMVHLRMPEGTAIESTEARVAELAKFVRTRPDVTGVSTFTGTGALRFLLTYMPEEPNPSYGLLLVDVSGDGVIRRLMNEIEVRAPGLVPDADVSCQRFVLGPGDPHRIQMRILGPEARRLRAFGDEALAILRADRHVKEVQCDWRNRSDLVSPVVSEERAARAGVSRADVARAYRLATEGLVVGSYPKGDEALPVVLRAPRAERDTVSGLMAAWSWSGVSDCAMPLAQLVDELRLESEERCLKRRDRTLCLTVKCNPIEGETASDAFARLRPALDAFAARLPPGYRAEYGGEYEDSNNANRELSPTFAPILALMVLVVLMLFNSIRKTMVIFLTLPLVFVGVVAGLLVFDQPFGFMALLGLLSLVGMQVKNAIVLMDEINANRERGLPDYQAILDAGVSRLRPVANASLTTVLGMIPLLTDAFYVAMAVTIMVGLAFATVLTMIVIPVIYAIVFRVRRVA